MNIDSAPQDKLKLRENLMSDEPRTALSIAEPYSCLYKDHAFFYGPKLCLMLAGIHRIGKFIPAYGVIVVMWLVLLFQVVYAIEQIFTDEDYYFIYQRIGNLLWFSHGILIYCIIAKSVFYHNHSPESRYHKYFSAMERLLLAGVVKRGQCDARSCAAREQVTNDKEGRNLIVLAGILSFLTIFLALINVSIVGNQFIGGSEWHAYFPFDHNLLVTIPITMVWYFVGYGWSLSIVFVCLPTYVFTLRAEEFAAYIEENVTSFDVKQAMSWYDDLYHSNKILNDIASPLITTNVALCFPLNVFLIMSYTSHEVTQLSSVSWIVINALIMLFSTGSVANLYAVNYRICMALGEKSSTLQFKESQVASYQLALLKLQSIPLGVRFFATRLFITPSIVFRAVALVSSFFVFLNANN